MIAGDPRADNTDLYAFTSPDDPSTVTIISNWIPFEEPNGGPNFYDWADASTNTSYTIKIDNNEAEAHVYLAETKRILDWDLDGAETEFKRALAIDRNSTPSNYFIAALYATTRGRSGRFRRISDCAERAGITTAADVERAVRTAEAAGFLVVHVDVAAHRFGRHDSKIARDGMPRINHIALKVAVSKRRRSSTRTSTVFARSRPGARAVTCRGI